MFKRTGYIIFTLLLTLSTAGLVISRHYCDQVLVSTAIDHSAEPCNHEGGDDCCSTETITVVLKVDFIQPVTENINIYEMSAKGSAGLAGTTPLSLSPVPEVPELVALHRHNQSAYLAEIQSYLL